MNPVIAIDPGPVNSAVIVLCGDSIYQNMAYYQTTEWVLNWLRRPQRAWPLVIEKIASYGMAVGETTFETVYNSGRFAEAYAPGPVHRMVRLAVKMHLCHDSRAKDANIRQALIDKWGGKEQAIGRKAAPGPLYGVSGDLWSALAVAVTWSEQNGAGK